MSEDNNENKKQDSVSQNEEKKKKSRKKKDRGEFKVVYKGRLLDGFSKADVVKNIVQLTKLPEDKIEQKFFSGKAVIIRRAHDQAHAQKLQQLFTDAGLEVIILRDTTIKQQATYIPKERTKKQVIQKELKKTLKQRKRPVLAIVLWVILIAIGFNLWNKYFISIETPESVIEIEKALANESLVFLFHANVERLLQLQKHFVTDANALPGTKSNFFNNLQKSGIDPRKTLHQLISASYVSNKALVSHHILLGQFPVQQVKRFLQKHHNAKVIQDPEFVRLRISELEPTRCQQVNFKEVAILADRILISTDGYLDELRRLLDKKPGNATDLSQWSHYRNEKLISLALFKPKEGASNAPGLVGMLAQGAVKKNQALESLYAGVGMQLLPPGGLVDVTVNSKDSEWLNTLHSEFTRQLEELKIKSQGLDSLQVLLNKITLEEQSNKLSLNLQLDGELKQSIESSIEALGDQLVSMGDSSTGQSNNAGVSEKIDEAVAKYLPLFEKSQLKVFNEQIDPFFKPAWIDGPFAVGVDELLMEQDQIVLQVRAKGQNIANIADHHASINILAVNDNNGNNVLERQKCGQITQQEKHFFTSWGGVRTAYVNNQPVQYTEVESKQKVKLKHGINFSDVQSLQAEIELDLISQTTTEQFAKPEVNKVLTAYDTRLLFKPSSDNTLSYTISGDEKRVLVVRALNQGKQYLSRSSSSSMSSLWGSGRTVSQSYQGKIAFIEVVYAKVMETLTYPVELTRFPPYYSDNTWQYALEAAKTSSVKQWNERYSDVEALDMNEENSWQGDAQAQWHDGPFNLALYDLKSSPHWGITGQLKIKTPVIDELRHNLSALEVYFRYPEVADNGDIGKSYYYQLKAKGYYMNGEFIPDLKKPYMDGQISFNLPAKKGSAAPKEINGDIIVHLPLKTLGSSYTELSIGTQMEDAGVKAQIIRLGNDIMEFEVTSGREQLVQIVLLDSNNKRISTADVSTGAGMRGNDKSSNIVVNYHGIPVKAQMLVSEGMQTRRYPFQLKLH